MKLYKHQKELIERIEKENITEFALFWEMGLAKTLTTLIILRKFFKQKKITQGLVILPKNLHIAWLDEIKNQPEHTGPVTAFVFESKKVKTKKYNELYLKFHNQTDCLRLLFVNVEAFSSGTYQMFFKDFVQREPTALVVDEASKMKTYSAKRTKNVFRLEQTKTKYKNVSVLHYISVARILLTGTPFTNSVTDLFTYLKFLNKKNIGTLYEFKNRYILQQTIRAKHGFVKTPISFQALQDIVAFFRKECTVNQKIIEKATAKFLISETDAYYIAYNNLNINSNVKNKKQLFNVCTKANCFFKKKKDCLDLPEQIYEKIIIDLDPELKKLYKELKSKAILEFQGVRMTPQNSLALYTRLQQLLSGVLVVDADHKKTVKEVTNKLKRLVEIIEELEHPVIIVTKFIDDCAKVQSFLIEKLSYLRTVALFSKDPAEKRETTIKAFQGGEIDILISTYGLISHGHNLQNCFNMVFYSQTDSIESRQQTEGRTHRIGQKNNCFYLDLLYENTIETTIKNRNVSKITDINDFFKGG
jgi:SNF2 family DNA or RNA helicase